MISEPSNVDSLSARGHSVNLAWDPVKVNEVSKDDNPDIPSHTVSSKNVLIYLLGRLNNHTARVIPNFTGFNGLKIWLLSDNNTKFCIEHETENTETMLPLVVLHMGTSRGLNLIPRKHDRGIVNVFDIELEDLSLLIESPKACPTMETNLGRETNARGSYDDTHIIIVPCTTEISDDNMVSGPVQTPVAVSNVVIAATIEVLRR